jgi:hypothetical protein
VNSETEKKVEKFNNLIKSVNLWYKEQIEEAAKNEDNYTNPIKLFELKLKINTFPTKEEIDNDIKNHYITLCDDLVSVLRKGLNGYDRESNTLFFIVPTISNLGALAAESLNFASCETQIRVEIIFTDDEFFIKSVVDPIRSFTEVKPEKEEELKKMFRVNV